MLVHVNGLGITCIEPEVGHLIKHINSGHTYKKVFLSKQDSVDNYVQVVDVNYVAEATAIDVDDVVQNEKLPIAKKELIDLSKALLAEFLLNNPLKSAVKNGEEKFYNVTSEKQNLLYSNIATYQVAQQLGMEFPIVWNSVGEVAEPWTIEEIMKLFIEIREYVSPIIAQQQEIEKVINNCRSVEELQKVNIEYHK